jgi:hypothetical protein
VTRCIAQVLVKEMNQLQVEVIDLRLTVRELRENLAKAFAREDAAVGASLQESARSQRAEASVSFAYTKGWNDGCKACVGREV